jgi:hypothetical protein
VQRLPHPAVVFTNKITNELGLQSPGFMLYSATAF